MSIFQRYGTHLRCYDNGGKTADRYTIMPPRWAHEYRERDRRMFQCIAADESPFSPGGFGQHSSGMPGPHLGKRVTWQSLPTDVRAFACQTFPEYCAVQVG